MAENRRAKGQHAACRIATPAHPGAGQALLELLDAAFNGARAKRPAFLPKFKVLHSPLVTVKVAGQVISPAFVQSGDNFVNTAPIKVLFVDVEPMGTLLDLFFIGIECLSRFGQVLAGVKPIDNLPTIGTDIFRHIPNPSGPVSNYRSLLSGGQLMGNG